MPYICDAIWWETRTVSMLMPSSPKSTLGVRDACSQLDGPRLSHAGSVLARGRLAPCCRVTYTAQQTQQITREARVTDDAEAEEPTPEQLAFLLESEPYTV